MKPELNKFNVKYHLYQNNVFFFEGILIFIEIEKDIHEGSQNKHRVTPRIKPLLGLPTQTRGKKEPLIQYNKAEFKLRLSYPLKLSLQLGQRVPRTTSYPEEAQPQLAPNCVLPVSLSLNMVDSYAGETLEKHSDLTIRFNKFCTYL